MAQSNRNGPRFCRGCGAEILIIKTGGFYKTVQVDAEPVWIRQQSGGDSFITADGRTVFGVIAGDADDDPDSNLVKAYESHFATCPDANRFRRR